MLLYQKRQITYINQLEETKSTFEKAILSTRLEIREETFLNISREIHDNIGLALTLAKLNLNTVSWGNLGQAREKVSSSIELLSKSIVDLSDISKGLNTDLIIQQGLITALENEITRINRTGLLVTDFLAIGHLRYLEGRTELIIFRIVQEAFNNILKHSKAKWAKLVLNYHPDFLEVRITDNGIGFDPNDIYPENRQAGIRNMQVRVKMLQGTMNILSTPQEGTRIYLNIPL